MVITISYNEKSYIHSAMLRPNNVTRTAPERPTLSRSGFPMHRRLTSNPSCFPWQMPCSSLSFLIRPAYLFTWNDFLLYETQAKLIMVIMPYIKAYQVACETPTLCSTPKLKLRPSRSPAHPSSLYFIACVW